MKFKNNSNDFADIIDNFFDKKRLNLEEFINKIENRSRGSGGVVNIPGFCLI